MKGNKGFYVVAMVAVIALCGVGTAQASGFTTNFTSTIASGLTDWTNNLTFPKFQNVVGWWGLNVDANRPYHFFDAGHLFLHHEQFDGDLNGLPRQNRDNHHH